MFLFVSCTNEEPEAVITEDPPATSTTTPATTEKINPPDTFEIPEGWDMSKLALLGYYIEEDDSIRIDTKKWSELEPDVFREYFFGTWSNGLVIDDSEIGAFSVNTWLVGHYRVSDNVVAYMRSGNAEQNIYWIETSEPEVMYFGATASWGDDVFGFYDLKADEVKSYSTQSFTKTDTPVNQPENGYLSKLKLIELSSEYDINYWMLTIMEYRSEDNGVLLFLDTAYQNYPRYLVSETPEKLVIESKLGNLLYDDDPLDITYTLEKIDGNWKRTVEITSLTTLNLKEVVLGVTPFTTLTHHLDNIGKTTNEIMELFPDLEQGMVNAGAVGAYTLSAPDESFHYIFYYSQAEQWEGSLAVLKPDEFKTVGVIARVGDMFPETYDNMSLDDFLEAIGASEIQYEYDADIDNYGWVSRAFMGFELDEYSISIDVSGTEEYDKGERLKNMSHDFLVSFYDEKVDIENRLLY